MATYSITSSARSRNDSGIVSPSAVGCGQIDDEIELSRLLDRYISGLRPAQDLVDIVTGAAPKVRKVWAIGHQPSGFDELPQIVGRRQSRCLRHGSDPDPGG